MLIYQRVIHNKPSSYLGYPHPRNPPQLFNRGDEENHSFSPVGTTSSDIVVVPWSSYVMYIYIIYGHPSRSGYVMLCKSLYSKSRSEK